MRPPPHLRLERLCALAVAGLAVACGTEVMPGFDLAGPPADQATTDATDALRGAADLAGRDAAVPDLAGRDAAALNDLARGDLAPGTSLGPVKLTYYWIADEASYTGAKDTVLCDVTARPLAMVPLAFANAISLEGTGRLVDGRLLNVGGSCACSSGMTVCYVVLDQAKYPWGVGAGSRPLVPFRSIAVDRTFIALGSKVYVPQLDGVLMPSTYGFVHDGCLVAADVGGGIKGAQIDFFAAEKANYLALDRVLRLSSVTVYVSPPRCP